MDQPTTGDWFPFFSMLFWCVSKVAGLVLLLFGLLALGTMLLHGFNFWQLLLTVALPAVLGFVVLSTEVVHDLATAELTRRQSRRK